MCPYRFFKISFGISPLRNTLRFTLLSLTSLTVIPCWYTLSCWPHERKKWNGYITKTMDSTNGFKEEDCILSISPKLLKIVRHQLSGEVFKTAPWVHHIRSFMEIPCLEVGHEALLFKLQIVNGNSA